MFLNYSLFALSLLSTIFLTIFTSFRETSKRVSVKYTKIEKEGSPSFPSVRVPSSNKLKRLSLP